VVSKKKMVYCFWVALLMRARLYVKIDFGIFIRAPQPPMDKPATVFTLMSAMQLHNVYASCLVRTFSSISQARASYFHIYSSASKFINR